MNRHRENTRKRRFRGGNVNAAATALPAPEEKGPFGRFWEAITGAVTKTVKVIKGDSSNANSAKKNHVAINVGTPQPSPLPANVRIPMPPLAPSQPATVSVGGRRHKRKVSKKQCKATKKHRKH